MAYYRAFSSSDEGGIEAASSKMQITHATDRMKHGPQHRVKRLPPAASIFAKMVALTRQGARGNGPSLLAKVEAMARFAKTPRGERSATAAFINDLQM